MNVFSLGLFVALFVVHEAHLVVPAVAQIDQPLIPVPAAQYITTAFDHYPLVALSEMHGNAESRDFLARLIREPGFAGKVNDIVIEFGNARYQDVVDRYIAGREVARDDLRGAWEDTTQVSDIWSLPMYEAMLADIRAVNFTLPRDRRFRVLLGDPPIDWRRVTSPADEDMNDWRDAHYAWVVENRVRAAGRRALLFIGGAHISRTVVFPNSLIHLLDARLPGQTHVVSVVDTGTVEPAVADRLRPWRVPSAAAVLGTWLGRSDVKVIGWRFSRGLIEQDLDAILYLSPSPLAYEPAPALQNASPRGAELKRRRALAAATVPFRGAQIRFTEAAAKLSASSEKPLMAVSTELQRDRALRVVVKAFADAREPAPLALSTARAEQVVEWLASRGIPRSRLRPLGCGAARPLWSDDAPEHRAANRRAEIVRNTPTAGCEPPSSFAPIPSPKAAGRR
jgi:outer membrane protein OmpA-like peptidoglycan-associated protein